MKAADKKICSVIIPSDIVKVSRAVRMYVLPIESSAFRVKGSSTENLPTSNAHYRCR